jgi:hypothetical protein
VSIWRCKGRPYGTIKNIKLLNSFNKRPFIYKSSLSLSLPFIESESSHEEERKKERVSE